MWEPCEKNMRILWEKVKTILYNIAASNIYTKIAMMQFPIYTQHDAMDCGPTCLRMIAAHYGRIYSLESLRGKSLITREGTSMLGISEAAESIGFRTTGVKVSFDDLCEAPLPCIVHWNQYHFVVVYDIKTRKGISPLSKLHFPFSFSSRRESPKGERGQIGAGGEVIYLSLIHISEPTRPY